MTENECRAGCGRPAPEDSGLRLCAEHYAYFDASHEYDEWAACAKELLPLFIQHAEALGNDALEEMFRENLERAKDEAARWEAELAQLSARL